MDTYVLQLFENAGYYAIVISLLFNIIVSILGVVPSFFITLANISFFGFGYGLILSIIGEALGAIVSFLLYRKGLRKFSGKVFIENKYLSRLQETEGLSAFFLVLGLRLAPFMPSGVITLVSAGSRMGLLNFSIASTIGKIPALFIEAYSVYAILEWDWKGKMVLAIFSLVLIVIAFRKKKNLEA